MAWTERAGQNAGELILVTVYILLQAALTLFALHARGESSLLFIILSSLFLASYVRTFAMDAGTASAISAAVKFIDDDTEANIRNCAPCDAPKRQRVHHCSVCETCVLRYDHHCPWVGNCVGCLNVRYFLQVLLYGAATALYSGIVVMKFLLFVVDQRKVRGHKPDVRVELVAFGCATFGSVFALAVFAVLARLLAFQCFLIAKDRTTLEEHIGTRSAARSYDRGNPLRNIRAVLGNNPLRWFFPV